MNKYSSILLNVLLEYYKTSEKPFQKPRHDESTLTGLAIKSEMPLWQNTWKVEEMFDFTKSAMNSKNRSRESEARRPLSAQNPRCHFRSRGNCLAWEGLGAMAAFGWRHVGRSRLAQASKGLVAICPRPLRGSYHPKPLKRARPEKKGAVVKMGPISRKPALPPSLKTAWKERPQPRKDPFRKKASDNTPVNHIALPARASGPLWCSCSERRAAAAAAAAAVATVKSLGPGRGTPSPDFGLRGRIGPSESKRNNGIREAARECRTETSAAQDPTLRQRPQTPWNGGRCFPVLTFTNTHIHTNTRGLQEPSARALARSCTISRLNRPKYREI